MLDVSIEVFCQRVTRALKEQPSSREGHTLPKGFQSDTKRCRMSPRLAYGRHRGPAPDGARQAAVLIAVYRSRQTDQLCLTLTRRPMTLSHHAGQICLPGGQIDPGETPAEAALREFREELGVSPPSTRPLGELPSTFVFASENVVKPFLVAGPAPESPWRPDPVEVDEVIEMPLETLFVSPTQLGEGTMPFGWRLGSRQGHRAADGTPAGYRFRYPALAFTDTNGHRREFWGATAMILERFAAVLARALG